jgi:hypothetical protein
VSEAHSHPPSRKRLLIGGIAAAIVAAAILLLFVLPAEFGIDPTGAGKATGLTGLSQGGKMTELERGALRKGVLIPSSMPMRTDQWEVELGPYESIEFKYTLAQGAPMLFAWRATDKLNYDMHAHPFEGGEALTESYGKAAAKAMQGLYVAPFSGIHGWYWHNRTFDTVKLTLDASGAFTTSTVFANNGRYERPVVSRQEAGAGQATAR